MTRPPSHIPASPDLPLVDLVAAAGILFVALAFVSIMADLISLCQYGVMRMDDTAGAVIHVKSPGQGTYSVADPRIDGIKHNAKLTGLGRNGGTNGS